MTRETKVGLVIGLGVILLVGIIVSEYFVRDETLQDQPLAEGLPDFNNTSNQSGQHPRERVVGDLYGPAPRDPQGVMSATERVTEPGAGTVGQPPVHAPGMRPGPVRTGVNVALDPPTQPGGRTPGHPGTHTTPGSPGHPGGLAAHQPPVGRQPGVGEIAALPPVNPPTNPGPVARGQDDDIQMLDTTTPPQPLPTQPPRPSTIEHVVAEGETLSHIARRYYNGDGNMWRSIRDANPDHVSPEGLVRAGTVLVIPKRGADGDTAVAGAAAESEAVGQGLSDPGRAERVEAVRGRLITVKEGDTLSGIASEHLGSAGKWQLLLDANADVLTDANQLRPGMRLRVPPQLEADLAERANSALSDAAQPERATPPAPRQPEPTAARESAEQPRTYTVVAGDSLYRIAEKTLGNGNRYHELFEANRDKLDDANDIREGMVLRVPTQATTRQP